MADAQQQGNDSSFSLRYILHHFQHITNTDKSLKCELNIVCNLFVELTKHGVLQFEKLAVQEGNQSNTNEAKIGEKLHDICSFVCVGKSAVTGRGNEGDCLISVTTKQHSICLYNIKHASFQKTSEGDLNNILHDVLQGSNIDSSEVVHYHTDNLIILVNKKLLVQVVHNDGQFHVGTSLPLPDSSGTIFQIIADTTVVLDRHTLKLSFYRTSDMSLCSDIDLAMLQIDLSQMQTWSISSDLMKLAVVKQIGDLLIVDLCHYCTSFPHILRCLPCKDTSTLAPQTVKQNTGIVQKSCVHTCEYGDFPWRDKLRCLHDSDLLGRKVSCVGLPFPSIQDTYTKHRSKYRPMPRLKSRQVTGFKSCDKQKRGSETKFGGVVEAGSPTEIQGFSVEEISFDEGHITLVYGYNDTQFLCQCSLKNYTWKQVRLNKGEKVVISKLPSLPHVVVMETHIVAMVTSIEMDQEQFVSELMVYGGASLADAVCHLNNWGRCSLPIHTLEVGLKHRQLDTVNYFLKSKENFFSTNKSTTSGTTETGSLSWAPQFSHYESLVQLEPALDLLLQTVRSTMGDKHSQIFGKQVLDATLDFLYGLLLDGLSVLEGVTDSEVKNDLQKATDKLLLYIEDIRTCVKVMEEHVMSVSGSNEAAFIKSSLGSSLTRDVPDGTALIDVGHDEHVPDISSREVSDQPAAAQHDWANLDTESVVEQGILKNMIPEMQQYLLQTGEYSMADYLKLRATGRKLVIKCIKGHEMEKAKELLLKLGLNGNEELWQIALYTTDMALCTSITEELLSHSSLDEEQVAMVTFLKELNDLYPSRNFDQQQGLHHHIKDCDVHEVQRLKSLIHHDGQYDLVKHCGNLATGLAEEEGQRSMGYNEVILAWVKNWNKETRDRIKLDVLLHTPDSEIDVFSKDVIWDYLLSRDMVDIAVAWIHNSFPSNQSSDIDSIKWPLSHLRTIPVGCVNRTELCTTVTRNIILKTFASHGMFTDEALASFPVLLNQLSAIGGPLQTPHPLSVWGSQRLKPFHISMIQFCVEHNLPYFLWSYCTHHRLSLELLHRACEDQMSPWLPLFLSFYSITLHTENLTHVMHSSSMINAASVWSEETSSVGELIKGNHPLAAMATLMYSPHKLQQVTFVTQQLEAFDGLSSETVERALQAYPKLQVSLFPASVSDLPHTDVSVYQLLMGNAPFDPTKLFGWQSTNSCIGEDCMEEMPYFSHAGLMSRFGYSEQLRYTYYLKQGRPSFAFITFLAEEFKNGGPTIPSKRLAIAIGTSLWMGVKHFHSSYISTSCVVFQELLGHDSVLLRMYIQVGNEILVHRHNAVTGTMDKRREQLKKNEQIVVELLLECVQVGRQFASEVKLALEAAILASITRERLSLCSYEAGERWILAVQFCHLLHLPYSTEFLESCAQTNQWLPFIWFAQILQYPKDQLSSLLHKFKSSHLQEHLRYVLANADLRSTQAEQKKGVAKKRPEIVAAKDMRSSLYKKIGVMKQTESDISSTSDDDEAHGIMGASVDTGAGADKDSLDMLVTSETSADDVFGVIFAAQATKCPWKSLLMYAITLRNCLFAELAACLQGSDVLPCLCSWLVSMMDATEHAQFLENHGKSPWRYNMQVLDDVINEFVRCRWGSILVTGFDIFQQNSPLLPFLQFYAEFTEKQNYNNCRLLLEEFKESIFQFHHERSVRVSVQIGDSNWLEHTTYRIIQYMLTHIPSVYEVNQLLKILDTESITLVFKNVDADFRKQSQKLACIEEADIERVDFPALLGQTSDQFERESQAIIQQMIHAGLYDIARRFAKLCDVNADHVTISQVHGEKKKLTSTDLWTSVHARMKFYNASCEKFIQHAVSVNTIASFYKDEAGQAETCSEKACLFRLGLQCIVGSKGEEGSGEIVEDMYTCMWTNRIHAQLQSTQNADRGTSEMDIFAEQPVIGTVQMSSAKQELMHCGKMPKSTDTPTGLNDQELKASQDLINDLLTKGEISEACRVTSMFSIYSKDLAIILTCIRLSLLAESLETMSADMLHLLRTRPGDIHRQSIAAPVALLRNSSTISLMSNIQPIVDTVSMENEEKISAMECLLNHCKAGRQTCVRILTAFKIAAVLCIGYDDVVIGEDYHILRSLLKTSCQAKFRLAADFLATSSLSPEQVAGFLSEAILQSYRVSLGELRAGDRELFFDPADNLKDFHQVVRLCREPSLLGNQLVDAVASMSGDLEHTSDKVLTLQTEVLILAHECYTASCDMEGISNILRAARILTLHLKDASEYQLMTRLLTGVGRYNEMTYIFDALHQSHQFELLLGKGMDNETKIKMAILDYLKRYHPGDTELYTMVALKFMMYREIAQLLEDNANKILQKLKGKPLENTPDTQASLQKVTQFLSDAAESYIKDNCLRHAQTCVRKARLVALQLKHLPSNQQFINLTRKGANLLIGDHPVFTEAYIISEAYQQKESWALALCSNVINLGNMKYLQEFRTHLRLTPQLIEDAVDRYQQSKDKSQQGPGNIKKLLQFCRDVKIQYRIAKQLGLRDIVVQLEKGDAKNYIIDFSNLAT